jgi:hypothetical protein
MIIWQASLGFTVGTFGSIIGGALLQTLGLRFWLTDLMVSPASLIVGVIGAGLGVLNGIEQARGFARRSRK